MCNWRCNKCWRLAAINEDDGKNNTHSQQWTSYTEFSEHFDFLFVFFWKMDLRTQSNNFSISFQINLHTTFFFSFSCLSVFDFGHNFFLFKSLNYFTTIYFIESWNVYFFYWVRMEFNTISKNSESNSHSAINLVWCLNNEWISSWSHAIYIQNFQIELWSLWPLPPLLLSPVSHVMQNSFPPPIISCWFVYTRP